MVGLDHMVTMNVAGHSVTIYYLDCGDVEFVVDGFFVGVY